MPEDDYKGSGRFVVIMEWGDRCVGFFGNDGLATRFETKEAAREAVRGRQWEHAWVWWIVELDEDAEKPVTYGTDLP